MPKFPTLAHIDFAYTAIPDYFLDQIAPTLKDCELRVMLYIYRRTLGYRKLGDCISYDQFIKGITTREGKKLDSGAGVSRRSLVTALAGLETRGLISRTATGYKAATALSLNLANHLPSEASIIQGALTQPDNTAVASIKTRRVIHKEQILHSTPSLQEVAKPDEPTQEGKSQPEPVQTLPVEAAQTVQNLHSTIKTKPCQKRVNHPVAAAGIQTEFEQAVQLLVSEIAGLGLLEARRLIEQAFANGRDYNYVKQIAEYVTTSPAIRVPAAVLTMLIKTNQERNQPDFAFAGHFKKSTRANWNTNLTSSSPSGLALAAAPLAPDQALPPEQLASLWQSACQELAERWQIDPFLLEGGSLEPFGQAENQAGLRLVLPKSDSLTRIRLSQAVKELLQKEGYYHYQLSW